jgi:hypothetical protein
METEASVLVMEITTTIVLEWNVRAHCQSQRKFNPLNAELNPICHFLAL